MGVHRRVTSYVLRKDAGHDHNMTPIPMHPFQGRIQSSSLGSLEPPFLKLATLTELADTHSSSLELRSAVQSRQIAQT